MKRQDSSIPQMQDLLCILVLQQCHCHHRTLAHTYAWSRPCLGHNQSFCLQQLHHQFSEWHHSPTKSLFHRHNENSQLELPDGKFIYVTFHKTCISFKVQTSNFNQLFIRPKHTTKQSLEVLLIGQTAPDGPWYI